MRTTVKIVLNILLLVVVMHYHIVYGQGVQFNINWGEIVRISYDSTNSVIPQVIAVGDTVHIMWWGNGSNAWSDSGFGLYYSRSVDGGKTFSVQRLLIAPENVNKYPHLVVSNSYVYIIYLATVEPPVYLAASIVRSTDAGVTWEPSRVIKDYDPWCVTARDSHIYIHGGAVYDNKYYNTMLTRADYGITWDTAYISLFRGPNVARFAFTNNAMHLIRSIGVHANLEIYYNRSTDQGKTWSTEVYISSNDSIESQNPRIAASDSTVYVTWNDGKYGGFFSGTVMVRRSTDEGLTWDSEQIISQKTTAIMCDISAIGDQCAVVWDGDESNVGSFRIRTSMDRGQTFVPTVDLAPEDQFPGDPSVFIDNSAIHVAWWDRYTTDVFYRKGMYNPLSVASVPQVPNVYSLEQNYPNPFNPVTTIQYDLPKESMVSLKVYNMLGQEVAVLVNGPQQAGVQRTQFNANLLATGVYIYRLQAGVYSSRKKMILVK